MPQKTGNHKTRRAFMLGGWGAAAFAVLRRTGTGEAQSSGLEVVPNGGAAGGPALYLPRGDLLNVRNIQGGVVGDTNLDIGAGSTANPGDIVLNWDVGRRVLIYDGHKRLVASFGADGVRFFRRVRFVRGQFKHRRWPWR